MASGRADWLDRLARRTAGGSVQGSPRGGLRRTGDAGRSGDVAADGFTRATSLKLAVVGAVSLSLGLWKTPVALAQSSPDLGKCLDKCKSATKTGLYKEVMRQSFRDCDRAFSAALAKSPRWRRFRRKWRVTPIGWYAVLETSRSNCYANVRAEARVIRKQCEDTCRSTCPRRSVQSASSTTGPSCQYTPPPKPSPPQIPPAPATEGGYCSDCAKGAPTAYCDPCPTSPDGSVCCYLKAEGGKSPCCSG